MPLNYTYEPTPSETPVLVMEEEDTPTPTPEALERLKARLMETLGEPWDETISIESLLTQPPSPFPEYPDEIGFEAFVETISQEEMNRHLAYILDKFLQWVKAVGRWLKETFTTVNLELVMAEEATKQLKFDLNHMPTTVRGSLTLKSDLARLSLRYRPIAHVGELIGAMASFDRHMTAYYTYVTEVLKGQVKPIMDTLGEGHSTSQQLLSVMVPNSPALLLKAPGIEFKQADDIQYGWVSTPLLNNIRLLVTSPPSPNTLSEINLITCQVARAMTSPGPVPKVMTIPRFDRHQALRLQAQQAAMIKTIKDNCSSQKRKEQQRLINDIETLITTLRRQGQSSDGVSVQQRIALARTLINWVSQPYRSLAANGLRVVKTTRRLCYHNLHSL